MKETVAGILLVAFAASTYGAAENTSYWGDCTTSEKIWFTQRTRVPGSLSLETVREAILVSLGKSSSDPSWATQQLKGQWFFEHDTDDTLYAGLSIRSHYLQLAIRYDSTEVVSIVCDSTNLKQSRRSIHRKVPGWKQQLDTRIRIALGKAGELVR